MAESKKRKTARERLTSLLGDFPQGFNAGMLAGIPGWAGDIGYLLQEYPRALLTDTPLRPPVDYAGTTDSIAKAAGYEIPGTLSGQLGAAVGGLLSPGPGDLAKFAPFLAGVMPVADDAGRAAGMLSASADERLETARKNAVSMLGLPENNTAADRATAMGFDRGYWRGGQSIADGPYYTPDEQAAHAFGARHGPDADVREYAIRKGKNCSFDGSMTPEDMAPILNVLRAEGLSPKIISEIASLPEDWGGAMPSSMLYQVLKKNSGDVLSVLRNAGYDTLEVPGQELVALHRKGTVRDANRAAFDPAQISSSDALAGIGGVGLLGLLMAQDNRREPKKDSSVR